MSKPYIYIYIYEFLAPRQATGQWWFVRRDDLQESEASWQCSCSEGVRCRLSQRGVGFCSCTGDAIDISLAQPVAGLKRLASFGARGGGIGARFFPTGANLVQRWVWAVFWASAGRCTETKNWCWKSLFSGSKVFFWGKHGAEISFFGVKISFFGAQKC